MEAFLLVILFVRLSRKIKGVKMVNIIGVLLGLFFTYAAMYLSSVGAGQTMMAYVDIISLWLSLGIPYGCVLAAYGKAIPDLKGMELMNKLFMPAAWLGTIIGWIMMFYGMGAGETENMYAKFGLSMGVSIITLLYGLMLKVIFTTLIESKK